MIVNIPGEGEAYSVEPIRDCPHTLSHHSDSLLKFLKKVSQKIGEYPEDVNIFDHETQCESCCSSKKEGIPLHPEYRGVKEDWICLDCCDVNCSRYVRGHSAQHFSDTQHALAFSFSDASYWCYECDYYVTS